MKRSEGFWIGKCEGVLDALEAVKAVRQLAQDDGKGWDVMIPLDSVVGDLRVLVGSIIDQARQDGVELEVEFEDDV